jgi:ABC-type branched-subunit amino acid transport system substrate-binding protein
MYLNARLVWSLLVLLAGASCLRADINAADNTERVIGLLVPPEEPEAASLRQGATLGVELANQAPGAHFRLIVRGRTGQWGADGVEAARMATDDGALGLISPPDGAASHLVLQVSGRTAVPVISLCADASVSQTGVPWMVRVVPRTLDEATTLFTCLPATLWTAVIPDGRAGREAARDLQAAATNSLCSLEKLIEVNPSATNTAKLAHQIVMNHPSAVLLWLDPTTAGRLAKALRTAGFAGTLAGPGRLRSALFAAAADDDIEGFIVPAPVLDKEAATVFQLFSEAFRMRFGHEPDATAVAAGDAARLLIHVLRDAGDRPVQEAFPLSVSFTGASGILAFDAQGNRKMNLQLFKEHEGQYIPCATGMNR